LQWEEIQGIATKCAGVAGALVSMRFLSGSIVSRLVMAAGGAIFSFFGTDFVAGKLSLPEGLAGFLLGLFGMSILSRAWEWVQTSSFSGFLMAFFKIPQTQAPAAAPRDDKEKK
jgi:hypothetical protein